MSSQVKQTEAEEILEIAISEHALLDNPLYNKGSAFSEEERREFDLQGLLPPHVATLEEQLARTYENYKRKNNDLERYIFLVSLQDRNETLFYRLLQEHIREMMPIIYTPVVGAGCEQYSHIYRRPRGLYIPLPQQAEIPAMLNRIRANDIAVIVVTDGERILGLGDLGVGGMGIPVGKLSLYTLCAGIHPARTLPIVLDTGTDNPQLLNDPLYLGWRHERVRGQVYDDFIEAFVQGVMQRFPQTLLQWEDFSKNNASRLLERYRDRLCTFNDDIQGTGAVTLAGLLAATQATRSTISQQRVVILGAGSSAIGISEQIVAAMMNEGLTEQQAKSAIWLLDSRGLVHSGRSDLEPAKQKFAQPFDLVRPWEIADRNRINLTDVVKNVQPTVLIGTSAQPGAFTEELIREMAKYVESPIILPLSNPTSKSEATPSDLLKWTDGRALIATGSPFPSVDYNGHLRQIGQCNNAFIFPGVGLGVIASGARRVTQGMFIAAARTLANLSPVLQDSYASLYPALEGVRGISRAVALAVSLEAQQAGLTERTSSEDLQRRIDTTMWTPRYKRYRKQ